MKNLFLLLVVTIALFTSCEGDEEQQDFEAANTAIQKTDNSDEPKEPVKEDVINFDIYETYDHAHLMDSYESGVGVNWVVLKPDSLIVVMDMTNTHLKYADYYLSVDLMAYDDENGIITGNVTASKNNVKGTFIYVEGVSFTLKVTNTNNEPSEFILY